jgi:hypothetical protein
MVATKQHGSQQALAMMAMDANRCAQQKEGLDLQLKLSGAKKHKVSSVDLNCESFL